MLAQHELKNGSLDKKERKGVWGCSLFRQRLESYFLLVWSASFSLGSSIAQFVTIWWITVETGSAMYLSLASFLGLTPTVLLSPFNGVLADRWSRKALIFTSDLLQALTTVVLILFFAAGNVQIWQALSILTLRGILQAFHSPAVSAILPSMVIRDRLSRMSGLNYLLSTAVSLISYKVSRQEHSRRRVWQKILGSMYFLSEES